jgi:hypothetical protein
MLLQNEAIVQLQDDVSCLRAAQCDAEDSDLGELSVDIETTVIVNYSYMSNEV